MRPKPSGSSYWNSGVLPVTVRSCDCVQSLAENRVGRQVWRSGRCSPTRCILLRGEGCGGNARGSRLGRMPIKRTLHRVQA